MHAKLHFSESKGLSLACQHILVENICTYRRIYCNFTKSYICGVEGGGDSNLTFKCNLKRSNCQ